MSGTEWLVIAGVFGLAFWGLLIWLSVRAKPLDGKPYRWATYIANYHDQVTSRGESFTITGRHGCHP
jgi:hypothetical protein